MELLVKYSKLCLDTEVINAFSGDHLVELAQVVSLRHVAKGGVAPLCNVKVLLLKCQLCESLPVGFRLRRDL